MDVADVFGKRAAAEGEDGVGELGNAAAAGEVGFGKSRRWWHCFRREM